MKTKIIDFLEQVYYKKLARMLTASVGKPLSVTDVERPHHADDLGYTCKTEGKRAILRVNARHPMFNNVTDEERQMAVTGIAVHEALHQYFTPFSSFERMLRKLPERERQVFALIVNILEDPAIENFSKEVVGGLLLKALKFIIAFTYKTAGKLEEAQSAFTQFVNAIIQYGDMGLLKGNFTFPDAKKAFAENIALFEQGINEPDGIERLKICKQIFENSRFLWEPELEKNEALQKLMEELAKNGKPQMSGSGNGQSASGQGDTSSKKSARRKITIEKISKEEMEEMKKNNQGNGSGNDAGDGDITVYVTDEPDENSTNGNSSIDLGDAEINDKTQSSEKGDAEDNAEGEGKDGEGKDEEGKKGGKNTKNKSDSSNNSDKSEKAENNDIDNNNDTVQKTTYRKGEKVENVSAPDDFIESDEANVVGEIAEDEYEISEEDIERIAAENALAQKEHEKEQIEEARQFKINDYPITSHKLGKRSCLNYRVSYDACNTDRMNDEYERILSELNSGIRSTTAQLKRIFQNDIEETAYRGNGKISINRLNGNRATARVFTKRVDPHDKSNFAVCILVDESGSMSCGGKAIAARKSCIALAEIFANLNIPCYIMGFTADSQGYDIIHYHYIAWKNTRKERIKLINMSARSCNCDGYSVRYATKVLEDAKAENKLLIVLSDGQPAARNYYDGIGDTRSAVREARNKCNVLGVAIGNHDIDAIHAIYERDFMQIDTPDELFTGLANKLKKIIKEV
jgi:nitric oxide reductase activation protein